VATKQSAPEASQNQMDALFTALVKELHFRDPDTTVTPMFQVGSSEITANVARAPRWKIAITRFPHGVEIVDDGNTPVGNSPLKVEFPLDYPRAFVRGMDRSRSGYDKMLTVIASALVSMTLETVKS